MAEDWPTVLQDLVDASVYKTLNANLGKKNDLFNAIDQTVDSLSSSSGVAASTVISRLCFLRDLYEVVQKSTILLQYIARDATITNITEVASKYYDCDEHNDAPEVDDFVLGKYKAECLRREPTAVLLNMVNDLELAEKDTIIAILKKASQNGFDTSRTSVSTVFSLPEYLDLVTTNNQKAVRETLETLQRLGALVVDSHSLSCLLSAKYTSARSIASSRRDEFATSMKLAGATFESTQAIYQQAMKIEQRNERLWTDLIKSRKDIPVHAVQGSGTIVNEKSFTSSEEQVVNLTTLFNEMDSVECDQFNSVLSPAAYLVDLLQLLQSTYKDPENRENGNVYKVLEERRPDIVQIALSKENTVGLVRYADLAVEIMEAHIAGNPGSVASESVDTTFGSIRWDVYEKKIKPLVAPMANFPLNLAHSTFQAYLAAMNVPLHEFVDLSISEAALSKELGIPSKTVAQEIHQRFHAASILRLQSEDFVAISGEGFFSLDNMKQQNHLTRRLSVNDYNKLIGRLSLGEYWGYKNELPDSTTGKPSDKTADNKMVGGVVGVDGLTFVRDQLLVRSNLKLSELLQILETLFVGRRFVITLQDAQGRYSDRLSDMRLRNSPLAQGSEKLDGKLIPASCSRLNVFIRLWRKCGWKMEDLDTAIDVLASNRAFRTGKKSAQFIDADILVELAAVKELYDITSVEIQQLLVLWGDMTTSTKTSIYSQLFGRQALQEQFPGLKVEDGIFAEEATFADHLTPLLSAFSMSTAELKTLLQISGVKATDKWNILGLSKAYRISIICEIFNFSVNNYSKFAELHGDGDDLFVSPSATLRVLRSWSEVVAGRTNSDSILELLSQTDEKATVAPGRLSGILDSLLAVLIKVKSDTEMLTRKYDPIEEATVFTSKQLLESLCVVFDESTSRTIVNSIEGTSSVLRLHNLGTPSFLNAPGLPKKLQISEGSIQLRAILTASELADCVKIMASESEIVSKAWLRLIDEIQADVLRPLNLVLTHLACDDVEATFIDFYTMSPTKDVDSDACRRRKFFLARWAPYCSIHRSTSLIRELLVEAFPELDQNVLDSILIKSKVKTSPKTTISVQDFLLSISEYPEMQQDLKKENFSAYFFARERGEYRITCADSTAPKVLIDGREVSILGSETESGTSGLRFDKNQLIKIGVSPAAAINSLRWSSKTIPLTTFSSTALLTSAQMQSFEEVIRRFIAAENVCTMFSLKSEELVYFLKLGIDLTAPKLQDLSIISSFLANEQLVKQPNVRVRQTLKLYEWQTLSNDASAGSSLAQLVTDILAWELPQVQEYFRTQYPGKTDVEIHKHLLSSNSLKKLNDTKALQTKVQVPLQSMGEWALALVLADTDTMFEGAQSFRSTCHIGSKGFNMESAHENLVTMRKDSLVAYLLSLEELNNKGIKDANNLFEYFLIDVQMGPQLQSSRIREAISSIQLLVQRSLLGLEKRYGISTHAVDQKKWAWMSRYSLWQASRQVFLYPENWIDPSLRMEKSELFKSAETAIMQGNLTKESINSIVKDYILIANDVADLDVQTYLWESSAGFKGTYHLFARTRTAPYQYYHRRMSVTGITADAPIYSWHAWTKLDIDIPPYEVDADGKALDLVGSYLIPSIYRGRLFLFAPQITLNTESSPLPTAINAGHNPTTSTPVKSWEIKMGWSEYRNNKWSKKETSQAALVVRAPSDNELKDWSSVLKQSDSPDKYILSKDVRKLAAISSFRFWVRSRSAPIFTSKDEQERKKPNGTGVQTMTPMPGLDFPTASISNSADKDVLVIDVFRWIPAFLKGKDSSLQNLLGSFELRGTQVVLAAESNFVSKTDWVEAIPTNFCKFQFDTNLPTTAKIQSQLKQYCEYSLIGPNQVKTGDAQMKAQHSLMVLPPLDRELEITPQHRLTWTLSFNESQYSGTSALVVERKTKSKVQAYFGIPRRTNDGQVDLSRGDIIGGVFTPQILKHDLSQALMESLATQKDASGIMNLLESIPRSFHTGVFGWNGSNSSMEYDELSVPYSLYNWELGFHLTLLLMERLLVTQQFELALEVAKIVFDPSANDKPSQEIEKPDQTNGNSTSEIPSTDEETDENGNIIRPLSNLDKCWKFPPFKASNVRLGGSAKKTIENLVPNKEIRTGAQVPNEIVAWIDSPFDPHGIARSRPAVYMKRFIMKYIEILIASGDEYFRQNSSDTISIALQRYVEAAQIFGPAPQIISRPTKPVVRTFADLNDDLTMFGTAAVDMELVFPYFSSLGDRKVIDARRKYDGVLGMVRSPYFPVPPNPQVTALKELIDDRFYKIRNNLDIHGNARKLALFDPPADPGKILAGMSANGSLSPTVGLPEGPMPNYRFLFLLQKAFEICAELKSMGDAYLSIKEKKDAESFALLKAKQEIALQNLSMEIKDMSKKEAEISLRVLERTRESHAARLKYHLALIGESDRTVPDANAEWEDLTQSFGEIRKDDELRMGPHEREEMERHDAATDLSLLSNALETTCSVLGALPKVTSQLEPFGVGVQVQFDASSVMTGMTFAASVLKQRASAMTEAAGRASRKAQLTRQLQDRKFQANSAARDIKGVDEQISAQKVRIDMANTEIRIQKQQAEQLAQVEEFYRTKYTGVQLYTWMDSAYRKLYYNAYLLALDAARSAQKAFQFERGPKAPSFLAAEYWDNGRDGAMSANNLYMSLKRMEGAYMSSRAHDFEISKNVSLRQVDPFALLRLQQSGTTEFSVPEVVFDHDFPGHYCRRIKSISVSIMCIVGPYTGTSCTLKLMEHRYRMRASSNVSSAYYPESYDFDDRYHTDLVPISSIAISNGKEDSGVFNLDFNGERYGPFEGAGVISRWQLEFPAPIRQFDYSTITDVVMNVKYTALDGGPLWQKAASEGVLKFHQNILNVTGAYFTLFDLKNDFSQQWSGFSSSSTNTSLRTLMLGSLKNRLPFWATLKQIKICKVWLALSISPGEDETSTTPKNDKEVAIDSKLIKFMNIEMKPSTAIGELQVFELGDFPVDKKQKNDAEKKLSLSLNPEVPSIQRSWLFIQYM